MTSRDMRLRDMLRARLKGRPVPLSQQPGWKTPPSPPAPSRGRAAGDAPPGSDEPGGAADPTPPVPPVPCDQCGFPVIDNAQCWEFNGETVLTLHGECVPNGPWQVTDRILERLGQRIDGVTGPPTGWASIAWYSSWRSSPEDDPA